MNTNKRSSTEQTVLNVLSVQAEATVAEIATTGKLGRSTVSKALVKLESTRKVKRSKGGREGARRLPDRWHLTRRVARKKTRQTTTDRLRPGQLDGLVLNYMRTQATDEPLGPTAISRGLGRSAGAVGNCLKRMAAGGQVSQTGEHPRRYTVVKGVRSRQRRG